MNAGPSLDALIAEKVFGWIPKEVDGCDGALGDSPQGYAYCECGWNGDWNDTDHNDNRLTIPKPYSTSIADAWPIADKLNLILVPQYIPGPGVRPRNGWAVYDDAESLRDDIFEMPGDKRALAIADTAPHTICLAALKVVDNS